jgi:hypothetical protein
MQWSFLFGEQLHLRSAPIDVLYLLSSLSLKVKERGPDWPTKNRVIRDATSRILKISTGILIL